MKVKQTEVLIKPWMAEIYQKHIGDSGLQWDVVGGRGSFIVLSVYHRDTYNIHPVLKAAKAECDLVDDKLLATGKKGGDKLFVVACAMSKTEGGKYHHTTVIHVIHASSEQAAKGIAAEAALKPSEDGDQEYRLAHMVATEITLNDFPWQTS